MRKSYDVAVIGGGPCGAMAAERLGAMGYGVALIDPGNRIKPCGGAIPSRALADFGIPENQLVHAPMLPVSSPPRGERST